MSDSRTNGSFDSSLFDDSSELVHETLFFCSRNLSESVRAGLVTKLKNLKFTHWIDNLFLPS